MSDEPLNPPMKYGDQVPLENKEAINIALGKDPASVRYGQISGQAGPINFWGWDALQGINESATSNYVDTNITGRPEPFQDFDNMSARTFSIDFMFHETDERGNINTNIDWGELSIDEVIKPSRWLDGLQYPVLNWTRKLSLGPPYVIVRVGNHISPLIYARCNVRASSILWSSFDHKNMPHASKVSVTFSIVREALLAGYPQDGRWL